MNGTRGHPQVKKIKDVLVFKFDEYSWYRNCLDELQDTVGKSGIVGDEVLGDDDKWTIYVDAPQVWVLGTNSIGKIMPIIEYYEGVRNNE